jgi:hypothetical protein
MRDVLEDVAGAWPIYTARRTEYDTKQAIPFRVSDDPFYLSPQEAGGVVELGKDITSYFYAVEEMYRTDEDIKGLLDTGKPDVFRSGQHALYAFVRPDIIVTDDGFSVCEIETSPFGLPLAEILNRGYSAAGVETMVGDTVLKSYVQKVTPPQGAVVFNDKTKAYSGQMGFLAEEILSGEDRRWHAKDVTTLGTDLPPAMYRGFYLSDYKTSETVRGLIDTIQSGDRAALVPSLTPGMEEKAILAFAWDKRYEKRLRQQLGSATLSRLRDVIPPTWVVGQEDHFLLGLPNGYRSSSDLAQLTKRQRAFVLKSSGFSSNSSWAEGVHFLSKMSTARAAEVLRQAEQDQSTLYVIQAMKRGRTTRMRYREGGQEHVMDARVRLTPYFAMQGRDAGKLIAVKATGCEGTDYIHASSSSINTACSVR